MNFFDLHVSGKFLPYITTNPIAKNPIYFIFNIQNLDKPSWIRKTLIGSNLQLTEKQCQ